MGRTWVREVAQFTVTPHPRSQTATRSRNAGWVALAWESVP